MDTIQRIRFPQEEDRFDLYFKLSGDSRVTAGLARSVDMGKGGRLSLDTYFNSFYEKYYLQYTNVRNVTFRLKLQGSFRVTALRESGPFGKETIGVWETRGTGAEAVFESPLLDLSGRNGRVYLVLECLSDTGSFRGGDITTPEPRTGEASIAVVICTFNRQGSLKKVLERISGDRGLAEKNFYIFVVDNAGNLSPKDFHCEKLEIVKNPNVGGSGGFNRGIIEGMERGPYTHFLLMDDDVELESESIYRLFGIYEHASGDLIVAGQMLDSVRDCVLYEAGAKYVYFSIIPRKHKLCLKSGRALNSLLKEEDINYGGYWFFCLPKNAVDRVGFSIPLFKHFDDIDLGIRLKESGRADIVSFPGIAVWHKPFDMTRKDHEYYYIIRNMLIVNGVHRRQPYSAAMFLVAGYATLALLKQRFSRAEAVLRAVEDYMKGPDFVIRDQAALHRAVLSDFEKYALLDLTGRLRYAAGYAKRWFSMIRRCRARWYATEREWKAFHKKAVTKEFWKGYLESFG